MLEIAIDKLGIGSENTAYVVLPANKNTVIDVMDRAKVFGETFVSIENCDEFPELGGYVFDEEPTIEELDFLTERIDEISRDTSEKYAYHALLRKLMSTVNEAINRTYNLETVPVYPCKNFTEYGKIVLENEMLEEVRDVPDELYSLLDAEKVGRVMAEREGGVFIDEYYIIPDSYEPVFVYDDVLPAPQEDWIFKLEIVRANDMGDYKMQPRELTLPANENLLSNIAEAVGEKRIENCVFLKFESVIPRIKETHFGSMEYIGELNKIAKKFSELSRENGAKFKAVFELENPRNLKEIGTILNNLDGYDFDHTVSSHSEFGEKYLSKHLPPDFDRSLLNGVCIENFGFKILDKNGGALTKYGAVSEFGGQLFAMIEAPEQEQISDFKMGGIS